MLNHTQITELSFLVLVFPKCLCKECTVVVLRQNSLLYLQDLYKIGLNYLLRLFISSVMKGANIRNKCNRMRSHWKFKIHIYFLNIYIYGERPKTLAQKQSRNIKHQLDFYSRFYYRALFNCFCCLIVQNFM